MKRLLAVACALLLLASARAPAAPAGDARRDGPLVVVLDPGHGGPFPHDGAHGARGLVEKTIALQISRRLKQVLEDAGATVLLTREDDDADVSLADRARQANEASADVFVSIHLNSMATRQDRAVTRGAETYFLSPDPTDAEAKMLAELENGGPDAVPLPKTADPVSGLLADLALGQARNDSAALAQTLHRHLIRRTGAQSRGVRQAPFLVLSGTKMPSALVEIGFISHPQEGKLLAKEKHQQKIAEALASGIQEFAAEVLARRLFPLTPEEKAALAEKRAQWLRAAKARAAAAAPVATPEAPVAPPAGAAPATAAVVQAGAAAAPVAPSAPAPSASAPAAPAPATTLASAATSAPPPAAPAAASAPAPAPADPAAPAREPASPAAPAAAPPAAPPPAPPAAPAPAPAAPGPSAGQAGPAAPVAALPAAR